MTVLQSLLRAGGVHLRNLSVFQTTLGRDWWWRQQNTNCRGAFAGMIVLNLFSEVLNRALGLIFFNEQENEKIFASKYKSDVQ
jgi:hypothetical protein